MSASVKITWELIRDSEQEALWQTDTLYVYVDGDYVEIGYVGYTGEASVAEKWEVDDQVEVLPYLKEHGFTEMGVLVAASIEGDDGARPSSEEIVAIKALLVQEEQPVANLALEEPVATVPAGMRLQCVGEWFSGDRYGGERE